MLHPADLDEKRVHLVTRANGAINFANQSAAHHGYSHNERSIELPTQQKCRVMFPIFFLPHTGKSEREGLNDLANE